MHVKLRETRLYS